jgi:hypothetical protein
MLYDIDVDVEIHVPQILWELEEHCQWQIGFWDAYSVVSGEGQTVVYVILSLNEEHNLVARQWYVCIHHAVVGRHFLSSRRLIEFRLNSGGSGVLCNTITRDGPGSIFITQIRGGPSPFFYILYPQLVFDTRTRLFYKFPQFHIALVCRDETNVAGC